MGAKENLEALLKEIEFAELAVEYEMAVDHYEKTGEGKEKKRALAEEVNDMRRDLRMAQRREPTMARVAPVEAKAKVGFWTRLDKHLRGEA